jgi:hypothetical protein
MQQISFDYSQSKVTRALLWKILNMFTIESNANWQQSCHTIFSQKQPTKNWTNRPIIFVKKMHDSTWNQWSKQCKWYCSSASNRTIKQPLGFHALSVKTTLAFFSQLPTKLNFCWVTLNITPTSKAANKRIQRMGPAYKFQRLSLHYFSKNSLNYPSKVYGTLLFENFLSSKLH